MPRDDSLITRSQEQWMTVRDLLRRDRQALTALAAERYPYLIKVGETPLLSRPEWLPRQPVPLDTINLTRVANTFPQPIHKQTMTPLLPDNSKYTSYSEAFAHLVAPTVLQNRSTYRLQTANLQDDPGLGFSVGEYFDGLNFGEAAAHELARATMESGIETALRDAIGDPCDLTRRPANMAISCLTIRRDDLSSFLLHKRDPTKVTHAGGLYQVLPVGVFQATSDTQASQENDFSLWHCIIRESSEEILGTDEIQATSNSMVDYANWPFASRMSSAKAAGALQVHCVGLGVDPLTLATDLLVVMVVESEAYDDLFREAVGPSSEGRILTASEGAETNGRIPFTQDSVRHFSGDVPMQPAGAAVLRLAWRHRDSLLVR